MAENDSNSLYPDAQPTTEVVVNKPDQPVEPDQPAPPVDPAPVDPAEPFELTEEEIRVKAFEIYERRLAAYGPATNEHDGEVNDWYMAINELTHPVA